MASLGTFALSAPILCFFLNHSVLNLKIVILLQKTIVKVATWL